MVDKNIIDCFFRWRAVQFPPVLVPSMEWQNWLYLATIGSDIATQYPVERGYCLRFCKNIIQFCQDCGEEVSELFYEKMGELHLQPPPSADSADYYKTYFLSSSDPHLTVSLREAKAVISGGTTGLSSWTAGEYLACWLDGEDRARLVEGKRVVELGAGSGISGIFALKRWRGILEYSFTDCHGKVLHNLGHNVERNCAGWSVVREEPLEMVSEEGTVARVMDLNWEEFHEEVKLEADVILGADLVFDPCLLPSLVKTLAILINRGRDCEAFLVCCVRNEETWQLFIEQLGQAGLVVNTSLLEGDSTTPVCMAHVYKL